MKRKGDLGTPVMLVVDALLLILMLSVILGMLSSKKPYDQIAVANFDKLSTAIQKACYEGQDQTISFTMDQPRPFGFLSGVGSAINILFDIGKQTMISSVGDPIYTIYYEAFPAGDAWTWEEYIQMPARTIYYFTPSGSEDKITNARTPLKTSLIPIVGGVPDPEAQTTTAQANPTPFAVGNVILDNVEQKISGSTSLMYGGGSVGKWDTTDASIRAFYGFSDFFQLSALDRSLVKYRACGENALCLKTPNGVLRSPLLGCESNYNQNKDLKVFLWKTKSTNLLFKDPGFLDMTKAGLLYYFWGETENYQERTLNLESPCTATLIIHKPGTCYCKRGSTRVFPLYSLTVNDKNDIDLAKVGSYSDCWDFSDTETTDTEAISNCILIEARGVSDFCLGYPGVPASPTGISAQANYITLPETSGSSTTAWQRAIEALEATLGRKTVAVNPYWPGSARAHS